MNIWEAIIQGIVQGLTEFLPVSSSGHLSISQHILGISGNNLFFNVMLHVGTLIAVAAVYHKTIIKLFQSFFKLIRDVVTGRFRWSRMDEGTNLLFMLIIGLLPLFLLFVPIPFSGGYTAKDITEIWSNNSGYFIVVGFSLVATSILLMVGIIANQNTVKKYIKRKRELGEVAVPANAGKKRYAISDAISVGVAQVFAAVFPGLSRSGSTLAVAELRGINKQKALDYTFVLAIPSILAAAFLEFKDAIETNALAGVNAGVVVAGVITSAVVGFFAILLFKWMLSKDRMYIFAIYTFIVGLAVVIIGIVELTTGVNVFTGDRITFG